MAGRALVRDVAGRVWYCPTHLSSASDYSLGATCFVSSRRHRVDDALAGDPELANFVGKNLSSENQQRVPITTDDWPYLYQKNRGIPRTYFSVSVLVILITILLYARVKRATQAPARSSPFFFSMGAGFPLMETQIISRLALFFGTVWQVNGIVIMALLLALLVANAIVEGLRLQPEVWTWVGLLVSLVLGYWFPFGRIAASPETIGIVAIAIFSIPVTFAGILFSAEFRNTPSPSSALNANVLGAVTGGLLENLSLLFGLRALLLVAIGVYCIAGFALWQDKKKGIWCFPNQATGRN
jgi:hypothetical protein